jgi:hypothetical protein
MAPLQRGAALFPAAALRGDPGILLTAARFFGPELLALGLVAGQLTVRRSCHTFSSQRLVTKAAGCMVPPALPPRLPAARQTVSWLLVSTLRGPFPYHTAIWRQGPFSTLVDRHVTDPWLRCEGGGRAVATLAVVRAASTRHQHPFPCLGPPRPSCAMSPKPHRALIDLECFVLSGMTAKDTLCAEMAFMFEERGRGKGRIDYPVRLWGGGCRGTQTAAQTHMAEASLGHLDDSLDGLDPQESEAGAAAPAPMLFPLTCTPVVMPACPADGRQRGHHFSPGAGPGKTRGPPDAAFTR